MTGSWLLAAGTWFHRNGSASGRETALLARFLEGGAEALAREIDGFFVVAVGDGRTGESFVITDPVGSHHAFLREEPGGIVSLCGSSLVLAALGREDLDPLGVQEIVRGGCAYEGRTAHRAVRRLSGGRVHRVSEGALRGDITYWRPSSAPSDRLDGPEAADALYESLRVAARRISAFGPKVIADLTGGYDSRAVAAGFLGAGVPFSTTVTGAAGCDDVRTAAALAKAIGCEHRWIPPRAKISFDDVQPMAELTDGELDLVEYSRIFAVQSSSLGAFDTAVHGSSGEIARGRFWMHLMPNIGRKGPIDATNLVGTRFGDARADGRLFPANVRLDLPKHVAGVIERETKDLAHLPNTAQCDAVFLALRMAAWQGRVASATDRLRRVLAPFLFRSVLDTMLSMTIRARYRSRVVREMFARHQPALGRVPMGRGYPPLPFGPRTALAFWPLPVYYAKRIATKVSRMAGGKVSLPSTAGVIPPARPALWQDERVRDLLDPRSMRLAAILDASRLETFLAESRGPGFAFDGAWQRLLSLETMLRRAEGARRQQAPAKIASRVVSFGLD